MINMDKILDIAIEKDASDIHLIAENKPILRIMRQLKPIEEMDELTVDDMNQMYDYLVRGNVDKDEVFNETRKLDTSYEYKGIRLRVNISLSNDVPLCTLRIIKSELPPYESLGLPDIIRRETYQSQGLILVTGKTNSGKTTTLNALINEINETQNKKIISYICRISEQKRPMLFLQIISKLKEQRQNFKAIVVGDGNLLPKMKEEAKKLHIYEDIIFTGRLQNTGEIYAISDITVNCSIKEGLALTSYESLSMEVPIVSSDVGGQKELITDEVGKIIELKQNEEDVYSEIYNDEEIKEYVQAINEILDNTNEYKENCRKMILDHFTINKMIEKMSNILQETYEKPNEQKNENGKELKNNINLCKELITTNLKNDEVEYRWECSEYERKVYGQVYSLKGMNYKKELLKDNLWKIPMWRAFVKLVHKLRK